MHTSMWGVGVGWGGEVYISGKWRGLVHLRCPRRLGVLPFPAQDSALHCAE